MEMGMANNGVQEEKNNGRISLEWDSSTTSTAAADAAAVRGDLHDEQWRELIGREKEDQHLVLPEVVKIIPCTLLRTYSSNFDNRKKI